MVCGILVHVVVWVPPATPNILRFRLVQPRSCKESFALNSSVCPKAWQLLSGKPVDCNYWLLSINYGLLGGIVACCFRLLGFPAGVYRESQLLMIVATFN